ncbi:TPM domain-containing protein [Diaminobutyricimonas aerilata]|uniref:TPM domain-containing protein n=1 Tax=Diaminobutyricimonas aerilata TaxID=1162967 RepID=UPI001472BC62|nr:TPM domain-containing protein [Diaminobutyricimonas aerilata]
MRTLAVAALAAVLIAAPTAAQAAAPIDLGGEYVVDQVGALEDRGPEVLDALDRLYDQSGLQLFVVYVDRFDGAEDGWADATAERNGLGRNDVLLAVATDDRNYELSTDLDIPLTEAQLDDVEAIALEPSLRENDWAGAAVATADGLAAVAQGLPVPEPDITPGEPDPGQRNAFPWGTVLLIGLGVLAAAIVVFLVAAAVARRRRAAELSRAAADRERELETRAGGMLVALDDALTTSRQELGFAIAEFGEQATRDFAVAIDEAAAQVGEAFQLRQQLDDTTQETPEQRAAISRRIIQLCEGADAVLDAQLDAFEALRDLEKAAPTLVPELGARLTPLRERIATTAATLTAAGQRFDEAALAAVAGNAEQADEVLRIADTSLTEARARLAAGTSAAGPARAAQVALAQADALLDAVGTHLRNLDEAAQRLDAAIADTESDLTAAGSAPTEEVTRAIGDARAALDRARAGRRSPVEAAQELLSANAQLDAVLTAVRTEQENRARATTALVTAVQAARTRVAAAAQFIDTRRGAVGAGPRTRLSEAQRQLLDAETLGQTDPVAALGRAQHASALADSALGLARADRDRWSAAPHPAQSGAAELGGLLGYLLGGDDDGYGYDGGGWSSGRRSGGWSGGSSGGLFGGSSGGWSSGRSSSSGSRRSSGGSRRSSRSSGGSRSSRRGRF